MDRRSSCQHGGSFLFWISFLRIRESDDIIYADIVIIGKFHQKVDGDGTDALLISSVDFPLAVQKIGDLLLRFIMVDPQIFKSLKFHI